MNSQMGSLLGVGGDAAPFRPCRPRAAVQEALNGLSPSHVCHSPVELRWRLSFCCLG